MSRKVRCVRGQPARTPVMSASALSLITVADRVRGSRCGEHFFSGVPAGRLVQGDERRGGGRGRARSHPVRGRQSCRAAEVPEQRRIDGRSMAKL